MSANRRCLHPAPLDGPIRAFLSRLQDARVEGFGALFASGQLGVGGLGRTCFLILGHVLPSCQCGSSVLLLSVF